MGFIQKLINFLKTYISTIESQTFIDMCKLFKKEFLIVERNTIVNSGG